MSETITFMLDNAEREKLIKYAEYYQSSVAKTHMLEAVHKDEISAPFLEEISIFRKKLEVHVEKLKRFTQIVNQYPEHQPITRDVSLVSLVAGGGGVERRLRANENTAICTNDECI